MAILSRGETRLCLLRFSGGFCGAERYSKQQEQVWSQHRVRTLVLLGGKLYRKGHKIDSECSEFRAVVCASGRERTAICQYANMPICQSRPGSTERSVQFIIGADCEINRKNNTRCC